MKNIIILLTLFFVVRTFAYVPSKEAYVVSVVTENGIITKTYMQETYADAYEYCSQIITLKFDEKTGEQLSSEAKETCNRIR